MALTKVSDVCPICKEQIEPGAGIYITKVNLTDNGRTGAGDGGMSFGGSWRATPKGKLRIKHLGTCRPRYCLHEACYTQKIEPLFQ